MSETRLERTHFSENLFRDLADRAPEILGCMIQKTGLLDSTELTFAAEALGDSNQRELSVFVLLPLLQHESALVREGAVYGLANFVSLETQYAIGKLAMADPNPGVRSAAQAAMETW